MPSIDPGCGRYLPEELACSGAIAVPREGQTDTVDITAEVELDAAPEKVRVFVADLDRYPAWLSILAKAEPLAVADDGEAWAVELRAKVGPLARSKRLRMVRTVDEPDHLRFERDELDGRHHAQWMLDAHLEPTSKGTHLRMVLHYSGGFGSGVVERLLSDEIEASKERLRLQLEVDQSSS